MSSYIIKSRQLINFLSEPYSNLYHQKSNYNYKYHSKIFLFDTLHLCPWFRIELVIADFFQNSLKIQVLKINKICSLKIPIINYCQISKSLSSAGEYKSKIIYLNMKTTIGTVHINYKLFHNKNVFQRVNFDLFTDC